MKRSGVWYRMVLQALGVKDKKENGFVGETDGRIAGKRRRKGDRV